MSIYEEGLWICPNCERENKNGYTNCYCGEPAPRWEDMKRPRKKHPPSPTQKVLKEVEQERQRQREKWGEYNHPDFDESRPELRYRRYGTPTASEARDDCDAADKEGCLNFFNILLEETCEAMEAPNAPSLRKELVQVAAVAVAWIEAIDRRIES